MASWVCVDASFMIRLLEAGSHAAPPVRLWLEWHEAKSAIVSPTLLPYELANALRRYVVRGDLVASEAVELLDSCLGLGIQLIGDRDLHRSALRIAEELALAATYDAHYLALADRLGAELWTADDRLIRAARGRIEVKSLTSIP